MLFGLAIQLTNPENQQFHAIALYRQGGRKDGSLMIGDLQSHFRTRRAVARPNPNVRWIAPDLSEYDQRILAKKIDAWLLLNENKIPYSVASDPGGVHWSGDVWAGNEEGQGLTCATFIVSLFKELGVPFINDRRWKARPGDDEWAQHILDALSTEMSTEHLDAQRTRIGKTLRVRPSDIASAAHLLDEEMEKPLTFRRVSPLAMTIEKTLLSEIAQV